MDMEFSPFNDNLLATCSADSTLKLWYIPDGGLKETVKHPYMSMEGHK